MLKNAKQCHCVTPAHVSMMESVRISITPSAAHVRRATLVTCVRTRWPCVRCLTHVIMVPCALEIVHILHVSVRGDTQVHNVIKVRFFFFITITNLCVCNMALYNDDFSPQLLHNLTRPTKKTSCVSDYYAYKTFLPPRASAAILLTCDAGRNSNMSKNWEIRSVIVLRTDLDTKITDYHINQWLQNHNELSLFLFRLILVV